MSHEGGDGDTPTPEPQSGKDRSEKRAKPGHEAKPLDHKGQPPLTADDRRLAKITAEVAGLQKPSDDKSNPESEKSIVSRLSREELRSLAESLSIHEMDSEITLWLANQHNIFTTTEPQDAGSLIEFRKHMETTRQLEQLRENTRTALKKIPEYQGETKLGRKLTEVFGAVIDVKVEGVHYEVDPKKKNTSPSKLPIEGTAIARSISYTVADKDTAILLSKTFQCLLRTGSLEEVYTIDRDKNDDGTYTVKVDNMTEYTNRVLGNAIAQLVAEDDLLETGTVLPRDKRSLKNWKDSGVTFDPTSEVEERLVTENERYQALGSETDKDFRTQKAKKDSNLLGTDAAAVFQVVRDAFRPIIHQYRGGDHHNKEQNPDENKRLLIEEGVHLTRDATTPEKVQDGPGSARALSTAEELRYKAKKKVREILEDKVRAGLQGTAKVLGGLTESALEAGLLSVPAVTALGKKINSDTKKWKEQKEKVAASRSKIADAIMELLLEEN